MRKIILGSAAIVVVSFAAATAYAGHGKGGRFDRLDTNGDGKVTAEEMAAKNSDWIERADANNDGAVTKEELEAHRKARRAERNPDKNDDGVIDREEFMAAAAARFERMDKNGDGVIGEDEKRKGRRHHRRGH